MTSGKIILEDGTEITGKSFGFEKSVAGEIVFNTGMVGYCKILTDPSYYGQILVLTFPMIGIYGVPKNTTDINGFSKIFESNKIHIKGLIISDYSDNFDHYRSVLSLGKWLKKNKIPGIYSIDTRQLTKKIRNKGLMLCKMKFKETIDFWDPNKENLTKCVCDKNSKCIIKNKNFPNILVIDCGIKNSILHILSKYDVNLIKIPWNNDFTKNLSNINAIFISNGPGNPEYLQSTINNVRKILNKNIPIFGICLGHQILALAAGCKTYKMKFGNRGMNQPVIDTRTRKCYITSQNHNYAVDSSSLPSNWMPLFINANDDSNEGIIHKHKPFFSVQFHPEGNGGPMDTSFLFDTFISLLKNNKFPIEVTKINKKPNIRKVLLLGSGGISIGQAGEFDYSGSQCIKALKEENIEIILVNPNIATIQTSKNMADKTYFVPVIEKTIEKIIIKEKPDGILLQFGGQTALNCGVKLYESGILNKYNITILGTQIESIIHTEDREIFNNKLANINEPFIETHIAKDIKDAKIHAKNIGFPVLVRSNYSLGGLGSGFSKNNKELEELAKTTFSQCGSITISKSLYGWKEVEYEVVRDIDDNCISVCNMENIDPVGIHTGDSIVVSPSLTLNNKEYFMLRQVSIKIARYLNILGECNVQFALDPNSEKYYVIEVNARLSRSSALASKATGYPLAYIAAKLSLGKSLIEIKNTITKSTTACFEPSLDYCIIKFPKWDNQKFTNTSHTIGSCMKSTGEVMAIGRTFEECFMKGLHMMDDNFISFGHLRKKLKILNNEELIDCLTCPNDRRIYHVFEAFMRQISIEDIHKYTKINKWFLEKFKKLVMLEMFLRESNSHLSYNIISLKENGFSDKHVADCIKHTTESLVREFRTTYNIIPFVKQIDTLSAEFPAKTNYLYITYNGKENDVQFDEKGIIVLGCGAYRIGSSVEFDWCAVSCNETLRKNGKKTIMINYNPETVSTDYDESDRLYFEELSLERVLDIYQIEKSEGIIVSMGGQIPNKLVMPLFNNGVKILGTHPENIDKAENRYEFSKMLDKLNVKQPKWCEFIDLNDAFIFSKKIGFPIIIRPSYVLSGSAMIVAYDSKDLENYLKSLDKETMKFPIVISKFIEGSREIEMDGVASDGKLLNYAISEHVENAGVHSGDATLILPPQTLYIETMKKIRKITTKIVKSLNITGPFNIQYLAKNNDIKVIECNLRASRSFPFASKTLNINLIELATRTMIENNVKPLSMSIYEKDYVCIKCPIFSFKRLKGVDPVLNVEMTSTGEVACFGNDKYDAYLKSIISSDNSYIKFIKKIMITFDSTQNMKEIYHLSMLLRNINIDIYSTKDTHDFLTNYGIKSNLVTKPLEHIKNGLIDLVINIPSKNRKKNDINYNIRRNSIDCSTPLITNIKIAILFITSINRCKFKNLEIKSWQEYTHN